MSGIPTFGEDKIPMLWFREFPPDSSRRVQWRIWCARCEKKRQAALDAMSELKSMFEVVDAMAMNTNQTATSRIPHEPWIGGKVVKILDRDNPNRIRLAIEDGDGVLWSGECVQQEIERQTHPQGPKTMTRNVEQKGKPCV